MGKLTKFFRMRAARELARQMAEKKCIEKAVHSSSDGLPVLIVSFNNGTYVKNTVSQLNRRNLFPVVIDNASSSRETLDILRDLESRGLAAVAYSQKNIGHMVGFMDPVYRLLPHYFGYTDPDLQFNDGLPDDFIATLKNLTVEFQTYKAGFALTLDCGRLADVCYRFSGKYPFVFDKPSSIRETEERHWRARLQHALEVYAAPIDTTFAIYNKGNYFGDFVNAVRVAGNFSAIHYPWFEELDIVGNEERELYRKTNQFGMTIR